MIGELEKVIVGNDAGWHVVFQTFVNGEKKDDKVLSIGSADYYGEIDATLPGDLSAGTYKLSFEGMTDAHYAKLSAVMNDEKSKPRPTLVARLFLYWRDTASSAGGYFGSVVGITDLLDKAPGDDALVAVLQVTKLSRTIGTHRYSAVLEARELVFHQLTTGKIFTEPVNMSSPFQGAYKIAKERKVTIAFPKAEPPEDKKKDDDGKKDEAAKKDEAQQRPGEKKGQNGVEALKALGAKIEEGREKHDRYGRGMFLIRDGQLYMGPDRPIPVKEKIKDLWFKNGLFEYAQDGTVEVDPNRDPNAEEKPHDKRKKYKLTLKGRPDLKPGDIVRFVPDSLDVGPADNYGTFFKGFATPVAFSEPDFSKGTLLYISGVRHQMSRTQPFATEVSGVEVWDKEYWDTVTPDAKGKTNKKPDPTPDEATKVVKEFDDRLKRLSNAATQPDVAEVRAFHHKKNGDPSQTEDVFRGLADLDGKPNQVRRLAVLRKSPTKKTGIGYLTPFAFGKAGLILPRYPGTRVLLVHRNADADEPIDVGALWRSPEAPDTQPGDYWLILPSAVDKKRREQIPADDVPKPYAGKASNDLIDADGNRVIQVGKLTLRFAADALIDAGKRPEVSPDGLLVIEHAKKNARIIIDDDGNVTIESKKDIKLKAANIKLEADSNGKIELKAKTVDVTVSDAMNVNKGS